MQETLKAWKDRFLGLFRGENGLRNLGAAILALVLLVLAIVVFVNAGNDNLIPFSKFITVVLGILLIALGAELVLLSFVFGEDTPNFFLYEAGLGKNISEKDLTSEIVSRRMDEYFTRIAENKGQLWLPGYVEKCDFGAEGQFRAVSAYKMLLDLAEVDSEGGWRCFCACSPATVQWIADSLKEYEPHMMKDILFIKTKFGTDPSKIRDCLLRNAPYLKRRMVACVMGQLEAFHGIQ